MCVHAIHVSSSFFLFFYIFLFFFFCFRVGCCTILSRFMLPLGFFTFSISPSSYFVCCARWHDGSFGNSLSPYCSPVFQVSRSMIALVNEMPFFPVCGVLYTQHIPSTSSSCSCCCCSCSSASLVAVFLFSPNSTMLCVFTLTSHSRSHADVIYYTSIHNIYYSSIYTLCIYSKGFDSF